MGKRQHYIPQFYLRGFSSDGISVGFFKAGDETYRKNVPIKSIMAENRLYDDDDHVEARLSKMESEWNASIASILEIVKDGDDRKEERIASSGDEWASLLHFICCSMVRTTGFLTSMRKLMTAMVDDLNETVPNFDPGKVSQLQGYDNTHEYVEVMLEVGTELSFHLMDLAWVFLVNETAMPFLTSDNPASPLNSYFHRLGLPPRFGLGSCGVQIFFPLTSNVCVILLDREVYAMQEMITVIRTGSRPLVRGINGVTARGAFNYLAFDPSLPKCEIKGLARKRKQSGRSRLGIFESGPHQPVYTFEKVQLDGSLLIPGFPIRDEALSNPISCNTTALRRTHSLELDAIDNSRIPEGVPNEIIAKRKCIRIIM